MGLLLDFLSESWSEDHIFLQNEKILNFQHKSLSGYNFVVAYHKVQKCFHGVLGFISPEFYVNREVNVGENIWLAIWKVNKSLSEDHSLGLNLLKFIEKNYSPSCISAIGINKPVSILYKFLGYNVQSMRQWFMPNPAHDKFKLVVGSPVFPKREHVGHCSFVELNETHSDMIDNFLSGQGCKGTFEYLKCRYLRHPSYRYNVMGIFDESEHLITVFVGREVSANGSKAFRLTELFLFSNPSVIITSSFKQFMVNNAYEYIDFLEFGFDTLQLEKLGFTACNEQLYVPHLFEPFCPDWKQVLIAHNINLPFSCTKGDSDLDRPNQNKSHD